MRAAKLALFSWFLVLAAQAQTPVKLKPLVMWQPLVEMDEQIFPS
ncbi:MAG: hypothetical protein ACRENG_11155 [bacterium]